MSLRSASIAGTLRSAIERYRPCLRTRVSRGNPRHAWNMASVHFPSTSSTSTVFRAPQPYTPVCSDLQGVRAHS